MITRHRRRSALAASAAIAVLGAFAVPGAAGAATSPMVRINPGVAVGLNPQPLPPRWTNPLIRVGLNPQPLPPRF